MAKIKLNESEKKVLTFWAYLAVFIICGLLVFRVVAPEKFKKVFGISVADKEYSLVTDRTRFFTVNSALIKYYSFINSGDEKAIMEILNESYVKKNEIDKDTLANFIDMDGKSQLSFSSRLMCQKRLDKNAYSFYVKGFESKMNTGERMEDVYYEVVLNDETFLFSVNPISKKAFGGSCHE